MLRWPELRHYATSAAVKGASGWQKASHTLRLRLREYAAAAFHALMPALPVSTYYEIWH